MGDQFKKGRAVMGKPHLTFFCELPANRLASVFQQSVLETLARMNAGVSLGILDLSPERADLVRKLNQYGISVTAWLLLPHDQGYWLGVENVEAAWDFYGLFQIWTHREGLVWGAIGLDIEPDIREFEAWVQGNNRRWALRRMLRRVFQRRRLTSAQRIYREMVGKIRMDGYLVESYQLPLIADERLVGSSLLRKMLGIVDIPVDREVWMLYSSNLRGRTDRPHFGLGVLWSYGSQAQAIGVGSTGGGVDFDFSHRFLDWDELSRDLRLAWYWTDHLYVFSLEGCLEQGFLPGLENFEWDRPVFFPESSAERVTGWRGFLQSILWVSARLIPISLGIGSMILFIVWLQRWIKKRRSG
jgi:hypothetical protein